MHRKVECRSVGPASERKSHPAFVQKVPCTGALCRRHLSWLGLLALACQQDPAGSAGVASSGVGSERVVAGDTTIVRTTGAQSAIDLVLVEELSIGRDGASPEETLTGVSQVTHAPDGGVLFYEAGARTFRRFDSAGVFLRNYGRSGDGPGEYRSPSGAVFAADGQLLIWDRQGKTVNVFAADGSHVQTWTFPVTQRETAAMGVAITDDGNVHTRIIDPNVAYNPSACGDGFTKWRVIRTTLDGRLIDTVFQSREGEPRGRFPYRITLGTATFDESRAIPLAPLFHTTYSRLGYWISGDAAYYQIVLHRGREVVRIESDLPKVAVSDAERRALLYELEYAVRRQDATVNPVISLIPEEKPHFKSLCTDVDGRIWVELHREAVREEIDTVPRPRPPGVRPLQLPSAGVTMRRPTERWVEPLVYDVFNNDGEFFGRVAIPAGATFGAASGQHLWLVLRDEMAVPRLVRYRMEVPGAR